MYYDMLKFDPVNNYYLFSLDELMHIKQNMSELTLNRFQQDMETLFDFPLETVMDKKGEFINKHDYYSLGTYWWPNKDTKDGLPYIRKDGEANPEGDNFDKDKLRKLAYLVYHAAILYFITEDKRYYQLIKKHCQYFFVNEETKMNPNMNHGQFIPGICDGRGSGIIDYAANFTYALHMLHILAKNQMLEIDFLNEMKAWHFEFRDWLLHSEIGIEESKSENNHGVMYDLLILISGIFTNQIDDIEIQVNDFLETKINQQIASDGSLPQEIIRTKSKNYTFMALKGMLDFSKISEEYGFILWNSKIKDCVKWLYQYEIAKNKIWPYQQITTFDECIYLYFMEITSLKYGQIYYCKEIINFKRNINKVPYYLFVGV